VKLYYTIVGAIPVGLLLYAAILGTYETYIQRKTAKPKNKPKGTEQLYYEALLSEPITKRGSKK